MTANYRRRATILLCSVAAAVFATSAVARPAHHRHRVAPATAVASQMMTGADRDMRYAANVERTAVQSAGEYVGRSRRHVRRSIGSAYARAQSHANSAYGGPTSNALVTEARKYIGTNPTGRASLWCGAFMDLVLKRTGHRGGGNLASAYNMLRHARVGTPGRGHRRDGTPWRRACWRRQRHRRKWQSDHCLRQSKWRPAPWSGALFIQRS